MTNNRIVIVIFVLLVAGATLVGTFPQTTVNPPANNTNDTLQSPTFSQNYNLPSLLGMWKFVPAPTLTAFPTLPIPPSPASTTAPQPTPTNTNVHIPPPTGTQPTTPSGPQPTPMDIGSVRPGRNLEEIARIAESVSCTPAAFLLAIKRQETGQRFFTTATPSIFQFYNTYGWWRPPYSTPGDVCYGYSYNTITGLIPSDAVGSGTRCANAIGNQAAGSQGIMGLMQINQSEQDRVTAKFNQFFRGGTPDRRVLFDAMVLGGFLYKSMSTQTSGCNLNWDLRDVAIVGCKFHGACKATYNNVTVDYCKNICEYYGQYGGPNLNCAAASNQVAGSATGCVLR